MGEGELGLTLAERLIARAAGKDIVLTGAKLADPRMAAEVLDGRQVAGEIRDPREFLKGA